MEILVRSEEEVSLVDPDSVGGNKQTEYLKGSRESSRKGNNIMRGTMQSNGSEFIFPQSRGKRLADPIQ